MSTADTIKSVLPDCADPAGWAAALDPAMQKFDINSKMRMACFLAQVAHESGHFSRLRESLFYRTPGRLVAVWPKRFPTEASATPFVANEERLGNFVYAGRMGNGNEASGDGFRFRGRGLIQLTGRSNYAETGTALGLDLLNQPELLEQPRHAASSAAFFWSSRGLNALSDDETDENDLEDFTTITRRVNGGTVGLTARFALFQAFFAQL